MGAVIEALEAVRGHDASSTQLASEVARRTLRGGSVGLLVNAGVYRDGSIMEPANATFVQRRIDGKGGRMLSFDLFNGACGVLNAMQVVDGFLSAGTIDRGLVVAADVDPSPGASQGYAYEAVGAAVLLASGGAGEGFETFWQRTYSQHVSLHRSTIEWTGHEHAVRLREDPSYRARCLECADDAVDEFLSQRGLRPSDVDLIVRWPSDQPEGRPVHTAGIAVALQAAAASEAWRRARRVLLVAVGSGITVAVASYVRSFNRGDNSDYR
jgi:3-oxoacyl-[acyl-carrier-protein] synthase III